MTPTVNRFIFKYLLARTPRIGVQSFLGYIGDAVDQEELAACAVEYCIDAAIGTVCELDEYIQSRPAVKAYYDSLP